jgi:sugar lactone lactonase YvrE
MTAVQATRTKASSAASPSGRLFLLELSGNRIHSMNPDGSDRKTIVTNCHLPDGIVVDAGGVVMSIGPTWVSPTSIFTAEIAR